MLGGTYALVALGLSMQYGIARIMNLAHGEFMIAAAFCAYVLFNGTGLPPLVTLLIALPLGYGLSWLVYSVMMHPLGETRAQSGPAGSRQHSGNLWPVVHPARYHAAGFWQRLHQLFLPEPPNQSLGDQCCRQ